VQAARVSLELIETLPITQRLVHEAHATLMKGVRREEKLPVSRVGHLSGLAPPPMQPPTPRASSLPCHEHLPDLLSHWERFVNDPPKLSTLIRCGLMHYQFETIHPFLDRNGRIGRLLIGLMLTEDKKLSRPLLHLSGYLKRNRKDSRPTPRPADPVPSWPILSCGNPAGPATRTRFGSRRTPGR
jgi:Fic family protein